MKMYETKTNAEKLTMVLASFLHKEFKGIITVEAENKHGELYPIEIIRGKNEMLYRLNLGKHGFTFWSPLHNEDEIKEFLRRCSY